MLTYFFVDSGHQHRQQKQNTYRRSNVARHRLNVNKEVCSLRGFDQWYPGNTDANKEHYEYSENESEINASHCSSLVHLQTGMDNSVFI